MLPPDLMEEVLNRVDGVTLAKATCASSIFRAQDSIWEKKCNMQWPSTQIPQAQNIILESGGFEKLYSKCYPLIVNKSPLLNEQEYIALCNGEEWWNEDDDTKALVSSNDLVSLIDVLFDGRSVLSKMVVGIPGGADDLMSWFSSCPFRIDLLPSSSSASTSSDFPVIVCFDSHLSNDKLWRLLWSNLRVSWILINTANKHMLNLSSWEPLDGERQWPTNKDFLISFGSILPAYDNANTIAKACAVQCTIILKCRLSSSSFRMTELSMKMEDMVGSRLNGSQSLRILQRAMGCERSIEHERVVGSYQNFMKAQTELKQELGRREKMLDTLALLSAMVALVSLTFII